MLHFVAHHGENEDALLLPLLRVRRPEVAARIEAAHAPLASAIAELRADLDAAPLESLYQRTAAFVARYLEHMREEEHELEPAIRAALTPDEIADFGRRSVARTSAADQRMMLGWMLPAMPHSEAEAFLARLPPNLAADLRPLAAH